MSGALTSRSLSWSQADQQSEVDHCYTFSSHHLNCSTTTDSMRDLPAAEVFISIGCYHNYLIVLLTSDIGRVVWHEFLFTYNSGKCEYV